MAFAAVVTTGIYCRPGCGARPNPANCQSFPTAAAAEAAGFRACYQCRPYRTGLSLEAAAPELVCRGVRMILDGMLDDQSEAQLARRLGVSARHLRRLFLTHLGATPDQLARSTRAHFARRLLDDTDLSITEIAFASGFGSIRQFNRIMRDTFRATPRELRAKRRRHDRLVADGGLALRLPLATKLDWAGMLDRLAPIAVPGVEHVAGGLYRRTITIDGAPGALEVAGGADDHLVVIAHLPFWTGLIHVVQHVRHLFNLDLDESQRHHPGTWDPFEVAVVAVIGDGLVDAATRQLAGRLVAACGAPVPGLGALGLSHTFPEPSALLAADLVPLGIAERRANTIQTLARAVVDGSLVLDRTAGPSVLGRALSAVDGFTPDMIRLATARLGQPVVFDDALLA